MAIETRPDRRAGPQRFSGAFYQPYYEQQDYRADEGIDDRADDAAAKVEADGRQQISSDNGSHDADDNVADQSKSAALNHHAGEPTGNRTDDQPNYYTHDTPLTPLPAKCRALMRNGACKISIKFIGVRVSSAVDAPGWCGLPATKYCTAT
jgi:hypothetical protein